MNRPYLSISITILSTLFIVVLFFVLQRRNRTIIHRVESIITEQNEMLRNHAKEQRLAYATLFIKTNIPVTEKRAVFLRLHDDMCYNCYASTIRELYKLEAKFGLSMQAVGAYHYDATFRQTLLDLDWGTRSADNRMVRRDSFPADEAMCPYLFTLDDLGRINNLLFLPKWISVETISMFFESVIRQLGATTYPTGLSINETISHSGQKQQ